MTTPSPTTLLSDEDRARIECGLLDGVTTVQQAASDAMVVLPLTRIERARWELRIGRARLALDEIARMTMDDDTERDVMTRRHWQEAQASNRAAGLVMLIWLCGWLLFAAIAVWWLR